MATPPLISELVERFERNSDSYTNLNYNEAQARQEFINPFFLSLGWDVYNQKGYAEAYKEVIHEYSQKTLTQINAPDYGFRVGGNLKFFVEAKKPSVNLKDDVHPAYQLRSYAWSSKLPISILTDFEEFAVYDCCIPPKLNDKAAVGRIMFFNYKEYIERWDELHGIFSPDAILKGSFDRFAASNKNKKGTAEVDEKFLDVLREWRELLARNIALRNPVISTRELNFAIQKIIDRIIFLRICEDRGIEHYGQLQALQNGADVYKRLLQYFNRADEKYNSGLFHFSDEKERNEEPDVITPGLVIDDKLLKEIFKNLYYPHSPFRFSVMPADILGQVYEQFLGKVIRLTDGHQAKVEDKPEVKKVGGVYYTPTYIVNYIVENTLGKLLGISAGEEAAAKQVTPKDVSKIKVLDPACGSGSFLIVAYQYLLDWHLKYYTESADTDNALKKNIIFRAPNGEYRLTTKERKRILLNNIFGVDIDSQAVEVTKLSLLLKVLEGETEQSIKNQMDLFRERALPDLSTNIKCGNSLIGPDFYDQMEMNFLDDDEKLRINVFEWNREFKEIMSAGGFDVVIGNPPYVFGGVYGIEEYEKKYFPNKYFSGKGKVNLFAIFFEKSLQILDKSRYVSFIIPNTILRVTSYKYFREFIINHYNIMEIVDLGNGVFKGATTSSIILTIVKSHNSFNKFVVKSSLLDQGRIVEQSVYKKEEYILNIKSDDLQSDLTEKLNTKSFQLGEICREMIFGVVITKNQNEVVFDKQRKGLKPFLEGKDIGRYYIKPISKYLLYEPKMLHRARSKEIFEVKEKIVIQRITGGKRPLNAAYDDKQYYNKESLNNIILKNNCEYSSHFVLAILNSKLINWYYKICFTNESTLTVNLSKTYLSKIPIILIDFKDNYSNKLYLALISFAKNMILLQEKYHMTRLPQEIISLQRQIEATDRQIDQLVYQLYGLTEEEIKIVEGE
jgi:type I restriction-modification system DNA methylase subunit